MSDVTRLLQLASGGDAGATDQLLPLVYDELRRLAAAGGNVDDQLPHQQHDARPLRHPRDPQAARVELPIGRFLLGQLAVGATDLADHPAGVERGGGGAADPAAGVGDVGAVLHRRRRQLLGQLTGRPALTAARRKLVRARSRLSAPASFQTCS